MGIAKCSWIDIKEKRPELRQLLFVHLKLPTDFALERIPQNSMPSDFTITHTSPYIQLSEFNSGKFLNTHIY